MAKAKKSKAAKKKKAKKSAKRAAAKSKRGAAKVKKVKKTKRSAKKAAPAKAKKSTKKAAPKKPQQIGEGDYAASRAFDKAQAGFVKRNKAKIPEMGKQAEQALEGPEGSSLRAAEQEAMSRSAIE